MAIAPALRRFAPIAMAAIAFSVAGAEAVHAQALGPVTAIRVSGDSLVVDAGADEVVFYNCTQNILLVDFRPAGAADTSTLVVSSRKWDPAGESIDTSGDPLVVTTSACEVDISRNPLRFHIHSRKGQLICEEPLAGGMFRDSLALLTSGGTFYGVHNRSTGTLSSAGGGPVTAGSQGGAGGPFAWTTNGWGLLADANGGRISISGDALSFSRSPDSTKRDLGFYVILGSPKQIITGLHEISGFPPLFPKYTLGFMNTEWGIDQTELYNDIRTYRAKSIPIDAYILDFDWMDWGADNYGEFRWGPKFPDGQSGVIVDTLEHYGMHLMGIRKPRVQVNSTQGQYCESNGFFVDHVTDYFSGQQVGRLNFLLPAVRSWFWQSFAVTCGSYAKGITGFWNDEADEYGGNLMFMEMERSQYEGQRSLNGMRVWSINRNFYTGAQRYAYGLWSGDIQSGFQSMADQRLFMLSSIVLGVSWWGMDIGGFQSTPDAENYFRWIQFGAFVPVFRVHGGYDQEREPWYFGAEAESLATQAIRLRYQLMPYIYSAAWESHLTGVSIARPLVLEYPDDPAVADLANEWMFGNSLLVSPVVAPGAAQQSVYLPEGDWYGFASGMHFSGSASYAVPVTHSDIPLFVKAGSIIPMSPVGRYVDAPETRNLLILASYPGGSGSCTIYDDDGLTYTYESGASSTTQVTQNRNAARAVISIGVRSGGYTIPARDWLADLKWIDSPPDSVVLDDVVLARRSVDSITTEEGTGWSYDDDSRRCLVRFPDDNSSHILTVWFAGNSGVGSSVADLVPQRFGLEQNYPNPFNPSTTIRFSLPFRSSVTLEVFNTLGQSVARIVDDVEPAGSRIVRWQPGIPSGIYFYRLTARPVNDRSKQYVETRKMLLIK